MKIIKNPNIEEYERITKAVKENDNYCPCTLIKNKDTICPCKQFREQTTIGECHCGRYVKIDD